MRAAVAGAERDDDTVASIALYVILDLEYARLGLIRPDEFDHLLVDVRASMDR